MNHKRTHRLRLALFGIALLAAIVATAQHPAATTQAQAGGSLGYGSKVYGTISVSLPLVTYSFTGAAGDFVDITAEPWTGSLDLRLELVAPNGVLLSQRIQNTLGGEPAGAHLSAFLKDAGAYLVRLSGENGTTGDFLLSLLGRGPATATALEYGQAVDVTIPQIADPQFFTFETEACPTTLVVTDLDEGQPFTFPFVVKVRDQRGQTVALLRGGEETEDWVTVQPDSGRYEVEVLAAEPALSGMIRLLVTCSGDNPGCTGGQTLGGLAGDCTPCPGTNTFVPGGGCPDLHLRAEQGLHMAAATTVFWDEMPGADGYTVRVIGITTDGGEVYLTHADWTPGDPTEFTWILPTEGYIGYRFTLEVLADGAVICAQNTTITIEQTSPECPDLGLAAEIIVPAMNAVALNWDPTLGADQFAIDLYSIIGTEEIFSGRLIMPGDSAGRTFDHFPPTLSGVRFVLWMTRGGMLCSDEVIVNFLPQQFTCPDLGLTASSDPATGAIVLNWAPLDGATGYELAAYGIAEGGGETQVLGATLMPSESTFTFFPTEGYGGFHFVLRVLGWPIECTAELTLHSQVQPNVPCAVRTDRLDIPVRVGPGPDRSIFAYLPPDTEILVVGQAIGTDGNPWWEIDKSQIPGGIMALSLWVAQSDVATVGLCTQVPQVEIPPVIPDDEEPGEGPGGGWGACGSCDTCGHPANECVTSPDGACLWDPATCLGGGPDDGGQCHTLAAVADPPNVGNAVNILTSTNCTTNSGVSGYLSSTVVQVSAVPESKFTFSNWTGCGASGSSNPVSITMTTSCTITGHFVP